MEKELYSLVRVFLYSSSNNIVSRARKGSFGIFVQKDAETTVLFEHWIFFKLEENAHFKQKQSQTLECF